jgi:CubicO group peptidase (beta-lactamase class C family)
MNAQQRIAASVAAALAVLAAGTGVHAVPPPATGVDVPELAQFDTIMQDFMEDNGISAGVLGILRNNCIVYMRGFGWDDAAQTVLLSPDQLFRMASVTKPVTAAAAQLLIDRGELDPNDFVFDLGQAGGGLLDYDPFPSLGDDRLEDIRVADLFNHRGGWEKDEPGVPDWTYQETQIASDMDVASPPTRIEVVRYILGQSLQFDPGDAGYTDPSTNAPYSNINYLVLGLIVEQVSGQSLISYIRQELFGQFPYVNTADIARGRTFEGDKHPREPDYHSFADVTNVFDPGGDPVPQPHGGWNQEARVGQGGLIAGAAPLLVLANNHTIRGVRIDPTDSDSWTHTGSLPSGTATVLRRRGDGICFVALFNRRSVLSSDSAFGSAISGLIDTAITSGGFDWPTQCVDGTWVDFVGGSVTGNGTFFDPYQSLSQGINAAPFGGNVQIKPGTSSWVGVITKRLTLRAPMGVVRIGE